MRAELVEHREREMQLAEANVAASDLAADPQARLAGHGNTRQKIHYVEQLKNENAELKKQLATLMDAVRDSFLQFPVHFSPNYCLVLTGPEACLSTNCCGLSVRSDMSAQVKIGT